MSFLHPTVIYLKLIFCYYTVNYGLKMPCCQILIGTLHVTQISVQHGLKPEAPIILDTIIGWDRSLKKICQHSFMKWTHVDKDITSWFHQNVDVNKVITPYYSTLNYDTLYKAWILSRMVLQKKRIVSTKCTSVSTLGLLPLIMHLPMKWTLSRQFY